MGVILRRARGFGLLGALTLLASLASTELARADVTGTVTKPGGTPVRGICVLEYGHEEHGVTTDSLGRYALPLQASSGRVRFVDCDDQRGDGSYLSEFYNDADSAAAAVAVPANATGIDAELASRGRLSGRVTDVNGVPISGIRVSLKRVGDSSSTAWADTSDVGGRYSIPDLPDAQYRVEFAESSHYLGQYYDGANFSQATPVSVSAGATAAGIDARLIEKGGISGRVTGGGLPMGNLCVTARSTTGFEYTAFYTRTDITGAFTVPWLDAGRYVVSARDCDEERFLERFYIDSPTADDADEITVRDGAVTQVGTLDLRPSGSLSGTVADESGNPLAGICVSAVAPNHQGGRSATTSADGGYTIRGLRPTDYAVRFNGCDRNRDYAVEYWSDKPTLKTADTVTVGGGRTATGVDERLASSGEISGNVTGTGGALTGVCVTLHAQLDGDWMELASDRTDANGAYLFDDLSPGVFAVGYEDCVSPGSRPGGVIFLPEFFRDATSLAGAEPISVGAGEVRDLDVDLQAGGSVAGVVRNEAGDPLQGICVIVTGPGAPSGLGIKSKADGSYSFPGLPTGDFKVQFIGCGDSLYAREYYEDAFTPEEADSVHVVAGAATTGVNPRMAVRGSVAGQVTSTSGDPLDSIRVVATTTGDRGYVKDTRTAADGTWTLPNLDRGDYRIRFEDLAGRGYPTQYYRGSADFSGAEPVTVRDGQTSRADVALPRGGAIAGRVTNTAGEGIAGACVIAHPADDSAVTRARATADGDGNYTLDGLATADYKVRFCGASADYAPEFYDDARTFAAAMPVGVRIGQVTNGIDATLLHTGTIRGRVTDVHGSALDQICVFAADADGSEVDVRTAGDGTYSLTRMPPGTYTLRFRDCESNRSGGPFLPEHYDDSATADGARPIVLEEGADVTADAILHRGGRIEGTVTGDPRGDILSYACVAAVGDNGSSALTWVDPDGDYALEGLRRGSYRVRFADCGGHGYAPEFYDDAVTPDEAQPVDVTPDATVSGVNARLSIGSVITGRVTGPDGVGLAEACVFAYVGYDTYDPVESAETDDMGRYELEGLPGTQVRVAFTGACSGGTGLRDEFWNDRPDLASSDPVSITPADPTTGIDAQLARRDDPLPEDPPDPGEPPAPPIPPGGNDDRCQIATQRVATAVLARDREATRVTKTHTRIVKLRRSVRDAGTDGSRKQLRERLQRLRPRLREARDGLAAANDAVRSAVREQESSCS